MDADSRTLDTLGKIYLIALLPFVAALVGQWFTGANIASSTYLMLVWSGAIALLTTGLQLGAQLRAGIGDWRIFTLVGLLIALPALLGLLTAASLERQSWALLLIALAHWLNLRWLQREALLPLPWLRHQQRWCWGVLGCHLLVGLNVLGAVRGLH